MRKGEWHCDNNTSADQCPARARRFGPGPIVDVIHGGPERPEVAVQPAARRRAYTVVGTKSWIYAPLEP
jgi:hypothetical protein